MVAKSWSGSSDTLMPLAARILFGPADNPRGQGELSKGWEVGCKSFHQRYVSRGQRGGTNTCHQQFGSNALCQMSLPSNMTPFELLFGRKPRTSLDSLVPLSAETEQTDGLDNFEERRKQNLREVRLALEKQHKLRVTARARANASISRPSAGVALKKGSLVLVRESESSRHPDNRGRKLQHDHYTGPWRVTEVLQTGLSMQVTMRGRKQRTRNVSTADVKPYYLRPLSLRHSVADEFCAVCFGSGFRGALEAVNSSHFDSLVSCRRTNPHPVSLGGNTKGGRMMGKSRAGCLTMRC